MTESSESIPSRPDSPIAQLADLRERQPGLPSESRQKKGGLLSRRNFIGIGVKIGVPLLLAVAGSQYYRTTSADIAGATSPTGADADKATDSGVKFVGQVDFNEKLDVDSYSWSTVNGSPKWQETIDKDGYRRILVISPKKPRPLVYGGVEFLTTEGPLDGSQGIVVYADTQISENPNVPKANNLADGGFGLSNGVYGDGNRTLYAAVMDNKVFCAFSVDGNSKKLEESLLFKQYGVVPENQITNGVTKAPLGLAIDEKGINFQVIIPGGKVTEPIPFPIPFYKGDKQNVVLLSLGRDGYLNDIKEVIAILPPQK